MKTLLILGAAVVIGVLFALRTQGGRTSTDEAHRLVAEGALLLDVRTTREFAQGHLPGALNIPVQNLSGRLGELDDRDRPIVVYCASGVRSARARRMLSRAGYGSVYDLGSMRAW